MVTPVKAFLPITICSAVRSQCRRSRAIPFATRKIWKQKMKLIVHVSATTFAPRLEIRKRADSCCVESQCWTRLSGRVRCTPLGSAWKSQHHEPQFVIHDVENKKERSI